MDLLLQFGHGMMALTRDLLAEWGTETVILSPRDLKDEQLERLANDVSELRSECLLDPQCFEREADHHKLIEHKYWKEYVECSTGGLAGGSTPLLDSLQELNQRLGCRRFLLPGLLADPVSEDWLSIQQGFADQFQEHSGSEMIPIATVALSREALRDEAQVEAVVERARHWPVEGYYVVAESPETYLVEDPVWLSNLLVLCAGLKLHRRYVMAGYASHQLLSLACANVDAIASGNYLNVRSFGTDKFFTPDPSPSRRTVWCYCPQSLSEYKIEFLDIALRAGVISEMIPDKLLGSSHAAPLFSGDALPSSVDWREPEPFRHYLSCLRGQCSMASAESFDEAVEKHNQLLDHAERLLRVLHRAGVRGQDRDFLNVVDTNRAALAELERVLGGRLRREWS